MSDENAADQQAMPVLKIEEMMHWGVAPDGSEAVLIVQSASQGPVRLLLSAQTLAELINAAQHAKVQAAKNAQAAGDDMVAAIPIDTFKVASLAMQLSDTAANRMILLFIDPNKATEMVYGFTNANAAIEAGRQLVQEGMAAQRAPAPPREGGTDLLKPSRRIIRPGHRH